MLRYAPEKHRACHAERQRSVPVVVRIHAETLRFAQGDRGRRFSRCHWPMGHWVLSMTWGWDTLKIPHP